MLTKRVVVSLLLGRKATLCVRPATKGLIVGLAQPSAVQASLQRYRLHFGNPDISPLGYIFSCTGFTSATPKSARQAFIFIYFYLIIA